jgi:hypothetical protein
MGEVPATFTLHSSASHRRLPGCPAGSLGVALSAEPVSVEGRKPTLAGQGSSSPRHHPNLMYFDLSKLVKRPLLGRHAP